MSHLIIAPVVVPLLAGTLILLSHRRPALAAGAGLTASILVLAVAGQLLVQTLGGEVTVYALGNWPAPYGIVLVLDRLAGFMLALTALLALGALLHALRTGQGRDSHFQALWQFQLFGLNGAFLTGDLFNLFVFFEVLLIASYGLLLTGPGGGAARTRATLHYVVLNLAGSSLFLLAAGLIYSAAGTLNMAHLAREVAALGGEDGGLLAVGALLLLVVFTLKAAVAPLHFWLPAAYSNAAGPVAALFAIMTKVGVYGILRVHLLIFSGGSIGPIVQGLLLPLALATILGGAAGALAATTLRRLVSSLVILSVGTLLAGISLFTAAGIAAALYYLLHTTLVTGALFLIADRLGQARGATGDRLAPGPVPRRAGLLGALFFLGAIAIAGLPPLSGFPGKLLVLRAAIDEPGAAALWAGLLGASLLAIIALSRAGSTLFWKTTGPGSGPPAGTDLAPAALLLAASPLLVLLAGPVHEAAAASAAQLLSPADYVAAVLGAEAPATAERIRP